MSRPRRRSRIAPLFIAVAAISIHGGSSRADPGDDAAPKSDALGEDVYTSRIEPIFAKYCTGCHGSEDTKGELILEDHAALLRGGENGPVVVPGKPDESRLIGVLTGAAKPKMPPGKRPGPSEAEIEALASWIRAGAPAPRPGAKDPLAVLARLPAISASVPPRRPARAVAWAAGGSVLLIARPGGVEVRSPMAESTLRVLGPIPGAATALAVASDGRSVAVAAGVAGLAGRVWLFDVFGSATPRTFDGASDALYAVALSPDGRLVAAAGWDRAIYVWDVEKGERVARLDGHNGAVYDLDFRRDGRVLASASEDWTVKLWDSAAGPNLGQRLDTFSESEQALHSVAFSPDGARVVAAGADRRIRAWTVSESAREGTNRIVLSRFAHEGPVLDLAFSPDGTSLLSAAEDRTLKLWSAPSIDERWLIEAQSDWAGGVAFSPDGTVFCVGRLDGTLGVYETGLGRELRVSSSAPSRRIADIASASPSGVVTRATLVAFPLPAAEQPAPMPPTIASFTPRFIARGVTTRVSIRGERLEDVVRVELGGETAGVAARIAPDGARSSDRIDVDVKPGPDFPAGRARIVLVALAGSSPPVELWVGDIEHVAERSASATGSVAPTFLPLAFVGTVEIPGESDIFDFDADAGDELVFDLEAARAGSKLDAAITVLDPRGLAVAAANDDAGGRDPFLIHRVRESGRHRVAVRDATLRGAADFDYRLSVGKLACVTGIHPTVGPADGELIVDVIGHHLPPGLRIPVRLGAEGEAAVELPAGLRARRSFKVAAESSALHVETEPNDDPERAEPVSAPVVVSGRLVDAALDAGRDRDLYAFEAEAGSTWVIETEAARIGSPVDTRIELLWADGRPVERLLLQATRDSYIHFRGIDTDSADVRVKNWEEMGLDQFLWMNGEVARIFRMPQGPDSGFALYTSGGKRRNWFDTTATAHALEETCYVVEPHPLGTRLVPNGLPVFTLNWENDDDPERIRRTDSRLLFTAPESARYIVRVSSTDTDHGADPRRVYRLRIRPAVPDFALRLDAPGEVAKGSAAPFGLTIDRRDGFEGAVDVEITSLPPGYRASSPLSFEAGHATVRGAIEALETAEPVDESVWKQVRIEARAEIVGERVTRDIVGFGPVKLGAPPPLRVALEPVTAAASAVQGDGFAEIFIEPGAQARAKIRIERNGHDSRVTFAVENLPFGVIVDNIGLSGVLIAEGESEREIFIDCAPFVADMDRLCHAVSNEAGRRASAPVWLRVRREAVARGER
jgi:dipeptidyl aminopeptidase/acylaminoacyl peptidase/mono/diheme cytochrome c family protein